MGLYLGYQHLTTFVAWLAGFIAAGVLLNAFCPDPRTLEPAARHEWRLATDPKYRFTLPEPTFAQMDERGTIASSLRRTLAENGFDVPDRAVLDERETADAWRSDPERRWRVETPLYAVSLNESEGEPSRLVVRSEGAMTDGAAIMLAGELAEFFEDEGPVESELREAFQGSGVALPADAIVREDHAKGGSGDENAWKVIILHCLIEEAKLEATAEARANGRELARREVVVLAAEDRSREEMPPLPAAYQDAHYIWFAFAGVGAIAFLGLLVFKFVTGRIDRREQGSPDVAA